MLTHVTDQRRTGDAGNPPPTDEERLDRVLTYIEAQEQGKTQNWWSEKLGRWSAYLALLAFLFGVGNIVDLRHTFDGKRIAESELSKQEKQDIAEGVKKANAACLQVWNTSPVASPAVTPRGFSADREVLANIAMAIADGYSSSPPNINRWLGAAIDAWTATAIDLNRRDEAAFWRDAGSYDAAIAAYEHDAIQSGFKSGDPCVFSWKFPSANWPFS
jgi:hypothetical protein